jgi:uncharacterized membrane-anchored protein
MRTISLVQNSYRYTYYCKMSAAMLFASPEMTKQLAPHAPTILMVPLIVWSIILIIIGIIIVATAQTKTAGYLLLVVGLLLGGGAFFVMYKTESRKRSY